jgi:transposase-like protein
MSKEQPQLEPSEIVDEIPLACADEASAVAFFERQRWPTGPGCVHCGSVNVYKMIDAETGQRNARYLWRCHDCHKQFTVRIGTVFEDSRIPLRHWAYAFWRASTSKKGASALEISRQCQISYKSALFLMHRIRFAMAPDHPTAPKLTGSVAVDETYVGGKPRKGTGPHKRGRGTSKQPVLALVERGGSVRARVIADISGKTLKGAIRELVDRKARIVTDELAAYRGAGKGFKGGHGTVNHTANEYVNRLGDTTNHVEGFFALLKRSIVGVYHNVSKKHLHRYVAEREFTYNHRKMNDGERTAAAIRAAEGKRLLYREPISA